MEGALLLEPPLHIVLLESRKTQKRPVRQGVVSIALHALVIAGAVQATTVTVAPRVEPAPPPNLIFVGPAPLSRSSLAPTSSGPSLSSVPSLPTALDLPDRIPLPDLGIDWNPRQWRSDRTIGSPGVGNRPPVGNETAPPTIFVPEEVDQPVEPLYLPAPRYPPALQQLSVEGRVMVRFVVDTLGVVEPDSWQVVSADHPAFAAAAREALLKARFRPALLRGKPVRQLVQQAVRFAVR
jgi:TonB family protein